jgi:hypothetical protein
MKLQKFDVLKITGCSDPGLWYAGLVGKVVPHMGFDVDSGYRSKEPSGFTNFVRVADASPVTTLVTSDNAGRWPYLMGHSVWELTKLAKHGVPMKPDAPGLLSDRDADHPVFAKLPEIGTATVQVERTSAPAGQSRSASLTESLANIVIGFVVSMLITAWLLPAYGHHVTVAENAQITAIFTVASLVRSYGLRRLFNWFSMGVA